MRIKALGIWPTAVVLGILTALAVMPVAWALGLGQVEIRSSLGQPLYAVVPLRDVAPGDRDQVTVHIPSPQVFHRLGVHRAGVIDAIQVRVETGQSGTPPQAILTTSRPVGEPLLQLLLQADSPDGQSTREYSIFLSPAAPGAAATAGQNRTGQTASSGSASTPSPDGRADKTLPSRPAAGRSHRYGPVKSGESLYSIALNLHARRGGSIAQMMVALYRHNAAAFQGNMNVLHAGAVLELPAPRQVQAVSRAEASRLVASQTRATRAAPHAASSPGASGDESGSALAGSDEAGASAQTDATAARAAALSASSTETTAAIAEAAGQQKAAAPTSSGETAEPDGQAAQAGQAQGDAASGSQSATRADNDASSAAAGPDHAAVPVAPTIAKASGASPSAGEVSAIQSARSPATTSGKSAQAADAPGNDAGSATADNAAQQPTHSSADEAGTASPQGAPDTQSGSLMPAGEGAPASQSGGQSGGHGEAGAPPIQPVQSVVPDSIGEIISVRSLIIIVLILVLLWAIILWWRRRQYQPYALEPQFPPGGADAAMTADDADEDASAATQTLSEQTPPPATADESTAEPGAEAIQVVGDSAASPPDDAPDTSAADTMPPASDELPDAPGEPAQTPQPAADTAPLALEGTADAHVPDKPEIPPATDTPAATASSKADLEAFDLSAFALDNTADVPASGDTGAVTDDEQSVLASDAADTPAGAAMPPGVQAAAGDAAGTQNQTAAKMALARAYLDMGETQRAVPLLEEIAAQGSPEQKQDAEHLLNDAQ